MNPSDRRTGMKTTTLVITGAFAVGSADWIIMRNWKDAIIMVVAYWIGILAGLWWRK